ncbi:uncharacterized protein BJX67DRAFT_386497 [Aspergillus lucknowensis]|uniref:Uncharacterized protein n=1 Tax=Aspergillus lucknowensis TaxID=176173 RepID=A0ABR4L5U8_9EURO
MAPAHRLHIKHNRNPLLQLLNNNLYSHLRPHSPRPLHSRLPKPLPRRATVPTRIFPSPVPAYFRRPSFSQHREPRIARTPKARLSPLLGYMQLDKDDAECEDANPPIPGENEEENPFIIMKIDSTPRKRGGRFDAGYARRYRSGH